MNNVEVPCEDITLCVKIANLMMKEVNCYPIFYHFDGKNYCRISAQIFNEIGDYQFAAEKFLEYLSKERNTMSNK